MYRVSNAAILIVLIGFPISCLLLKVCNYDAGCVWFGIAGLSFIILVDKYGNVKVAFAGTGDVKVILNKSSDLPKLIIGE